MANHKSWSMFGMVALLAALTGILLIPSTRSSAQVQQGATMTVLRGQVAVIHADGSAVQPAPSGTTVNAGDEIRTLGSTSALITFFSGTEIELEQDTIIAIEQVNQQGDRVEIALKQAFGTTINRVQSLAGTGSTYRVDAGGAVALVRGTTFAVVGPITTSAGNAVILVCGADCSSVSTFAGCPLQPFTGFAVLVDKGEVETPCETFAVGHSADLTTAAFEAITTVEQLFQGDTNGTPAGQVQSGQRQEISSRTRKRDDDDDAPSNTAPTPTPTVTTSGATVAASGALPQVSISDVSGAEGTGLTFTLTLSAPSSQPVTVFYTTANGTATAPADYTAASGSVTFPPGTTTTTITIQTIDDNVGATSVSGRTVAPASVAASAVEPPETLFVNLTSATGATIGDGQGVGTIVDGGTVSLSINDVTVTEGASATFTVSLSIASSSPVTVNYATADGSAIAPGDYTPTSGTLTIPAGSLSGQIVVATIVDTVAPASIRPAAVEPPETFAVNLSGASGATIADPQGVGTILDPVGLTLSINDVTASEGGPATFTVTLSAPSSQAVTVQYATATGTAGATDFTAASGTLTIPAGTLTQQIIVATTADAVVEPPETFAVNLSSPTVATIADAQGVGTIVDPGTLTLSINNTSAAEGANMVFTVSLAGGTSSQAVTVQYATAPGTASASDFTATSGALTIPAGSPSGTITVPTTADTIDEVDESFTVTLSNPTVAAIATGVGTGVILDDDAATLSIANASATEGANVVFTVSLSVLSSRDVTVQYATATGTAGGSDFTATSGTLTIPAGSPSGTITVPTTADTIDELDEAFTVTLSTPTNATIATATATGTIVDDDTTAFSINSVSQAEGNDCSSPIIEFPPIFAPCGTTAFTFTVTLSSSPTSAVTVHYSTGGGTAVGGSSSDCQFTSSDGGIDYVTTSGTLSFPAEIPAGAPGGQTVTVQVCADEAFAFNFSGPREGDETFNVTLDTPTGGATIGTSPGVGTIQDDDHDPDFFEEESE